MARRLLRERHAMRRGKSHARARYTCGAKAAGPNAGPSQTLPVKNPVEIPLCSLRALRSLGSVMRPAAVARSRLHQNETQQLHTRALVGKRLKISEYLVHGSNFFRKCINFALSDAC